MKQRNVRENIKIKGGIKTIKSAPRNDVYVVLDNIKAMENVGAIFRTCDGARVKKIYLCGITATPPRNKIFKTSMGAVEWVDWEYAESAKLKVKSLKAEGIQIVALEQTDKSIEFTKAKYKFPLAIILGHERNGVSADVLKLCDLSVEIPMHGRANSLNVATSAGIVLFEVVK
ncbi:MAG: RNA methyltransferase [Candidatus Berkelbacteria bacterium]|nr:RNA methyltransferase [Candidatus Berkelbacteria bacterium]